MQRRRSKQGTEVGVVFVEGYLTRVTPVGRSLGFSQTSAQLLQGGSGVKAGAPEGHSCSSLLSAVAPAASARRGAKKVLLFLLQMCLQTGKRWHLRRGGCTGWGGEDHQSCRKCGVCEGQLKNSGFQAPKGDVKNSFQKDRFLWQEITCSLYL